MYFDQMKREKVVLFIKIEFKLSDDLDAYIDENVYNIIWEYSQNYQIRCLVIGQTPTQSTLSPQPLTLQKLNNHIIGEIRNDPDVIKDKEYMKNFDCLIISYNFTSYSGDHLASIIDDGMPVVITNSGQYNIGTNISGRYVDEHYYPFYTDNTTFGSNTTVKISDTDYTKYFRDLKKEELSNAGCLYYNNPIKNESDT
eukprot:UN31781